MENELRGLIAELLAKVTDLDLLDLVSKLLLESTSAPQESGETIQPYI